MKRNALPDRDTLLKFLSSPEYRPLRRSELYRRFSLSGEGARELRRLLRGMERAGDVLRVKGGRYALPREVALVTGRLQVNPKGFGFVTPAGTAGEDIYIHGENMSRAMHGDTVAVRVLREERHRRGRRAPRREGKVLDILERANESIVGTLRKSGKFLYVVPDNPRLPHDICIAPGDAKGAREGQKVVVRLAEWESSHTSPGGTVTSVLGTAGEPETDLLAIIHGHGLKTGFPAAALAEANRAGKEVSLRAIGGREDLRALPAFTIDPVDARDFDDAVSLDRRGNDWLLGVHIADVSHYVTPESALDREARERATSVYFPSRVLPMLPEALSNGLCSLRENEDRLTQSAFLTLSPKGRLLGCRFASTVIRSRKRFTYARVSALLKGEAPPEGEPEKSLLPVLKEMERLALVLRANRFARGALDLDMPEAVIEFDRAGRVTAVRREEFDISHILIEEFMLAANEAVGGYVASRRAPALWRVHDVPDDEDLVEFVELIKPFGYSVRDIHDVKAFQRFLDQVKGKPESYALRLAFLRSLKLAVFATRDLGHYGLGCRHYLYFTSPIRRYPDLVTHRVLRDLLEGRTPSPPGDLDALAAHCSEREERAEEAERECLTLRKLQHLSHHVSTGRIDTLEGVIIEIKEFGFVVYLNDYLLQGLVPASGLADDFYRMSRNRSCMVGERTRRRFRVGDVVTVRVDRVDMIKRQVDFALAEERGAAPARRRKGT